MSAITPLFQYNNKSVAIDGNEVVIKGCKLDNSTEILSILASTVYELAGDNKCPNQIIYQNQALKQQVVCCDERRKIIIYGCDTDAKKIHLLASIVYFKSLPIIQLRRTSLNSVSASTANSSRTTVLSECQLPPPQIGGKPSPSSRRESIGSSSSNPNSAKSTPSLRAKTPSAFTQLQSSAAVFNPL